MESGYSISDIQLCSPHDRLTYVSSDAAMQVLGLDLEPKFSCEVFGKLSKAALLDGTSLAVLVGHRDNPDFSASQLLLWDAANEEALLDLSFRSDILRVRLYRRAVGQTPILVVVLLNSWYLYLLEDSLKELHGVCYVNSGIVDYKSGRFVLIGEKPGSVRMLSLREIETLSTNKERWSVRKARVNGGGLRQMWTLECNGSRMGMEIVAHESGVACVALSDDGKLLATTSERGTVVRVFATETGKVLKELQRGRASAAIHSLAMDCHSNWLCLTSDRGTLHLFSLHELHKQQSNESKGFLSYYMPYVSSVLPSETRDRSLTQYTIPGADREGVWSVATFHHLQQQQEQALVEVDMLYIALSTGALVRLMLQPEWMNSVPSRLLAEVGYVQFHYSMSLNSLLKPQ